MRSPRGAAELLAGHGTRVEVSTNGCQERVPQSFSKEGGVLQGHNTPLHLVACIDDLRASEMLRQCGAIIYSSNVDGLMAIHMAGTGGQRRSGGNCSIKTVRLISEAWR